MRRALCFYYVAVLLFLCSVISCCFYGCQGYFEEERAALLEIKVSINSPKGTALSSWLGEDCCQWEGVDCSLNTSRVNKLFLDRKRDDGLGMWYPNATSFAQFEELQELHLRGNDIGGQETLEAFCELKNLRRLDLSDNSIEGWIPACLGNMPSLGIINLSNNRFQNFSSSIFSNLTTIEHIDVSHNDLAGLVAFSMFANLSKLRYLDLSDNELLEVETESPTWIPSFELYSLNLAGCNLNNKSGSRIPSFISTHHTLRELDLSYNSLVGIIPSWLFNNISTLLLGGNMFGGPFPLPLRNTTAQLLRLDFSDNLIHGPLPANIGLFLTNLILFNMSFNELQGIIPSSIGEIRPLKLVDLSNNKLSGEIPHSLTKNCTSMTYLSLSNNNLQGEMLSRDFNMMELEYLQLEHNSFTGTVSPSLLNCSSLFFLSIRNNYFSGTISSWLTGLPYIFALLIGENHFEGQIPMQLCEMQYLHLLDFSKNNLSGKIPPCLNNITALAEVEFDPVLVTKSVTNYNLTFEFTIMKRTYRYAGPALLLMSGIDLSVNQLMGNIPLEMGNLTNLLFLNLSNNLLTGYLPSSIQNIAELEGLDLSHNQLTGPIPSELDQLLFLAAFNVSYNNLSGKIPIKRQFSTFDESSYVGNPGLCGEPLNTNCSFQEEEGSENTKTPSHFNSCATILYAMLWAFGLLIAFLFN